MSNREKVLEQMRVVICDHCDRVTGIEICDLPDECQILEITEGILAIPGLRIEAEDQTLPENPWQGPKFSLMRFDAHNWAQQDMIKQGWVKCDPKAGGKIDG